MKIEGKIMSSRVNELEEKIKKLKLDVNQMEIDSLELELKLEDLAPEDSELEGSESEALMPEDLESEPEDLTLEYSELEYLELEDLISYKSTSEEEKSLNRNRLSVSLHAMFAVSKKKLDGQEKGHPNMPSGSACKRKVRDGDITHESKRLCNSNRS
jgi:hypothetical protein